ncbi:MAG TPA: reverse transcriptase domain-containing protein [Candidatus Paceibacterota bacterium]|nr:reverse transcriptase domain-containing protein [Candidatus Paceibacterota bacterium]
MPSARRDRYTDTRKANALGKFISQHRTDPSLSLQAYTLSPYRGIVARKKNGKFRPLLVPVPRDRLAFGAALSRIKKLLESRLAKYNALGVGVDYDDSPTVRKICLKILEHVLKEDLHSILALDFQDYFSSINRKKLNQQLRPIFRKAGEIELYKFVWASVNNAITTDSEFQTNFGALELDRRGIPQGLAYSPLLASFFGIKIDRIVARRKNLRFYRYLDDMVVLGKTKEELTEVYEVIKNVADGLDLKLHPIGGKTKLLSLDVSKDSFEFLGVVIAPYDPRGLLIPESALEKFKEILRLEIFTKGADITKGKKVFKDYALGWARHYKTVCPEHYAEVVPSLNAYITEQMEKKRSWTQLSKDNPGFFEMP